MSKRGLKIALLLAGGGVLLQWAGCANLLVQQIVGTVAGSAISAAINCLLESAGATAT